MPLSASVCMVNLLSLLYSTFALFGRNFVFIDLYCLLYYLFSEKCGLGSQLIAGDLCQPCPRGSYKAALNESFCVSCPVLNGIPTTTYFEGSRSSTDCKSMSIVFCYYHQQPVQTYLEPLLLATLYSYKLLLL